MGILRDFRANKERKRLLNGLRITLRELVGKIFEGKFAVDYVIGKIGKLLIYGCSQSINLILVCCGFIFSNFRFISDIFTP